MADFQKAFERTMAEEGGYVLHKVKDDPGGMTYAGIARTRNPGWPGWSLIDSGYPDNGPEKVLKDLAREFYRVTFWSWIRGDDITSQAAAEALYDFAVNAGPTRAIKTAQIVVKETQDGRLGPLTLAAINKAMHPYFLNIFALERVRYYVNLAEKNPALRKFLRGWVNRALRFAPSLLEGQWR